MKIGIIGAGHAGVAAAQTVAKEKHEVILFSNEKTLPYFRPRIPSVAFGQATVENAIMHPEEWYKNNNIDLKLNSRITEVTSDCKVTTSNSEEFLFDKIIFSYGAGPIMPPFAKGISQNKLVPLWNMENAISINSKINKINDIVIIGGGVIGLEAALRAVDAGFKVKVIEKAETLLPRNLNPKMSKALAKYLSKKNIEVLSGISVEGITEASAKLEVKTDKTAPILTELVIMSIGAGVNCSLAEQADLNCTRKVTVNEFLQSTKNRFFAAGDIAELPDSTGVCSALRAAKQGKITGLNSITEKPETVFTETPVTLQVKYNNFSMFAVGNPYGDFSEKILEEDKENNILRIVNIDKDNKVVGVQMLGSNQDFKKYEKLFLQKGLFE
jgi:NAD(P)H-nitrite reductase large subunit